MALYVYNATTGALVSWCPEDTDPVAPDHHLEANGLAVVTGLPPLNAQRRWDEAIRTVVEIHPRLVPRAIATSAWFLRFTPDEFKKMTEAKDAVIDHFLFSIRHATYVQLHDLTVRDFVSHLVNTGLLASSREDDILR